MSELKLYEADFYAWTQEQARLLRNKPYLEDALRKAYLKGVELAVGETDLPGSTFSPECPYNLAESWTIASTPVNPAGW